MQALCVLSSSSFSLFFCCTLSLTHTQHTHTPLPLRSAEQRERDTSRKEIAEAFVLHEDYQRALCFIQLERLYHQRVLDNLNALQEQWESQCGRTPSNVATHHLDTLKQICQTHTRPRTRDAECASLDLLRQKIDKGGEQISCPSAPQVEGGMEHRAEDSFSHAMPSIDVLQRLDSPEISEKDRGEDPNRQLEGKVIFHEPQLTEERSESREGAQVEEGVGGTVSDTGNGLHPCTAVVMDQSKPAEQQGEDLSLVREKEAKGEERESDLEEAAEALEMEEEEAEDEGEETQQEGDSSFCQKALPVETLFSGAVLAVQELNQDAGAQERLHDETSRCQETQESPKSCQYEEERPLQEAHMKQEVQEEEGEEDYEVDQADLIREAPSLDEMAKLITVEEISPASGLVSILKKRSVSVDRTNVLSAEPAPEKATAKRRVRFKVPDDSYEHEVGGGDSCLLLFLLCLVTVVISVGGTALYCAVGDAQSSVCQDFSRNADFYVGQLHRGISQIQHWLNLGS